ncbi:putative serine/threonine-protein kinase [Cucurbita moschata]|uniref:Serine/threonine-protein kinase n=1 Tax=Cucurbita moschata TaxID=3662 RepID=A0A6J1HGX6_CUCMO|nr:putative serine/threonine-protein kinase [Cucurbita moschata]XP_022963756.1 putative serine/threonine-protein kinase [Cucurbita moschata]
MLSSLLIVFASLASFIVGTVVLFCIFFLYQQIKSKHRITRHQQLRNRNLDLSSVTVDGIASFDPSLCFSMAELRSATKNFSNDLIVGDGSFGIVYKARLSSGDNVAIKKLNHDAFQGFREFRAEMETLGKLRHRNIVKILGYCVSGSDRLLIYEFLERGSLDNCLYETSTSAEADKGSDGCLTSKQPLPWETRLKIMRGVANGLSYLHGLSQPIIHRDIKAGNVLLDSEYEAHIADFGLARMIDSSSSHVSTQFAGTWGYMRPEYRDGVTAATVKADVYSFGILMFEVAMGRRPNLPMVLEDREVGLIEWARILVAQNKHMEMVDASILKEDLVEANVKEYFRIACLCTSEKSKERPLMLNVVELLDRIYDVKLHDDNEYQNKLDV